MGSPVVVASPRKSPSSGRRTNKPLVEKKRRARINGCLGQLKSLILNTMQTDGAQVSRLEKADILEMTVKYLRHIQRQQVTAAVASEPEVVAKFSAGYTECATEVIRYMDSVKCVTPEIRSRLESHLVERLRGSLPTTTTSATQSAAAPHHTASVPNGQSTVTPAYARSLMSSTTSATANDEEMTRHYQTALDLANMAAAVTAKEAATVAKAADASHGCERVLPQISAQPTFVPRSNPGSHVSQYHDITTDSRTGRSQSISPSNMTMCDSMMMSGYDDNVDTRRRHNSSEPALPFAAYQSQPSPRSAMIDRNRGKVLQQHGGIVTYANSDMNNNYVNDRSRSHVTMTNSGVSSNSRKNIQDYLSTFQRPLHIHIPDSPPPTTTPSPPFLHPHTSNLYTHQQGIPRAFSASSTSSSSSSTSIGPVPTHTSNNDAPATILYGCHVYRSQTSGYEASVGGICGSDTYSDSCRKMGDNNNNDVLATASDKENNYAAALELSSGQYSRNGRTLRDNNTGPADHVHNARAQNYHYSLPKPAISATPSPPTLIREEPLPTQQKPSLNSKFPTPNGDHSVDSVATSAPTRYYINYRSAIESTDINCRYNENVSSDNQHHQQQQQQHHQHQDHHLHKRQPQPSHHSSSLPSIVPGEQTREIPTREDTINNGQKMNGPAPCARVPSRQKETTTSLSPPTLKRRLLSSQRSEGSENGPRDLEGCPDKRRSVQCRESYWVSQQQNCQARGLGHEQQTRLCYPLPDVSVPAAMACTTPAHAVSADDRVWRPW